jgi:hypothetical protein
VTERLPPPNFKEKTGLSRKQTPAVIPAFKSLSPRKRGTGIQKILKFLDSRLRGNDKEKKKNIFIGLVAVPALVGLIFLSNFAITCQKKKSLVDTDAIKAKSRVIPLELSKVEFVDLNGEKFDEKNIPLNTYVTMKFYLLSWDARADEKLDLTADIRIYSQKNHLLVFKPEYARFSQTADMKKDKILLQTKLRFSDQPELGFYRVFITVKENSTQRQNSVQSRIRVVKKTN